MGHGVRLLGRGVAPTAVSYTHLDVYKRQVRRLRQSRGWSDSYEWSELMLNVTYFKPTILISSLDILDYLLHSH